METTRSTLGLWVEGVGDVARHLRKRGDVPSGQSGGALSPLLETIRAGHAARWIEGERVLDYGCGRARLLRKLGDNVLYTGVDHDPTLVSYLSKRFPRAKFLCANLEDPGAFNGDTFDSVSMLAVMEHLASPQQVVDRAASLLRPGGVLVVTTPHPSFDRLLHVASGVGILDRHADEDHEGLLSSAELERLCRNAGFRPETRYRFLLGGNQLLVARKVGEPVEDRPG